MNNHNPSDVLRLLIDAIKAPAKGSERSDCLSELESLLEPENPSDKGDENE